MSQNSVPKLEEALNKVSAFLFITCFLSFILARPAHAAAVYNPNNSLNGAQSQNIGEDEVESKDPLLATVFSIMPGIVFHGFGNFYAGDYDNGTRMLTMEILGGGLAIWGHNVIHNQGNWSVYFGDQTPSAGYWIKAAGVGMMAISFIWDVSTAGEAAQSWNRDHQINFQMESREDGLQLALSKRF
jgi:hypothetical protein